MTALTNSGSGWSQADVIGTSSNAVTVVTNRFAWFALGVLFHPPMVAQDTAYLSANVFHDLSDAPLTIQYNDGNGDPLALTVHTAIGALVRHLVVPPGASSAVWDGKDDSGSPVSTGLYLVAVKQANGTTVLRKVVVLKQ